MLVKAPKNMFQLINMLKR
uniref:Uncharacterized protein n=1 Tax=Arundo donax TaxID=35708 RepID=A0A0A9BWX7_ARUDO